VKSPSVKIENNIMKSCVLFAQCNLDLHSSTNITVYGMRWIRAIHWLSKV